MLPDFIVELNVNVNNTKILSAAQQCYNGESVSPVAIIPIQFYKYTARCEELIQNSRMCILVSHRI